MSLPRVIALSLLGSFCAVGCGLFDSGVRPGPTPATSAASAAADQRTAQARAEADRALVTEVERLRQAAAGGGDDFASMAFAAKLREAADSRPAKDGRLDMDKLVAEAVTELDLALGRDARLDAFAALAQLPKTAAGNAAILRTCPEVRARVTGDDLVGFTATCLASAGGDETRLAWPSARADLAVLHEVERERAAAAEAARRAAEEERAAAEAEQKKQARGALYAAAAVFASGRCEFQDCMKSGWTVSIAAGELRVHCEFQDCLKNGWTASLPDGGEARTRCMFQDCMKNGWETSYPGGKTAHTRCELQECAKYGWETEIPDVGTATTRCALQDCFKNGWSTDMPGGGQSSCRCNLEKCLENGAACG